FFPKTFSHLFSLPVPGFHTILNTAAGIAVCIELLEIENIKGKHDQLNNHNQFHNQFNNQYQHEIGDWKKSLDLMASSLLKFRGAKRRGEIIAHFEKGKGIFHDTFILDDYAHHPTAIKTTLQGFKDFYPDHKIIVSFMSHTYSRTQALIDEFSASFSAADSVFLHKIYSSARENKEKYLGNTSGEILFEKTKTYHPNVQYFDEFLDAVDAVISLIDIEPCVFITMGAGDNWKLGKAIVEKLKKRSE
ncbi:MAG TPA: cyanophycin synthetase, partial [Treponemataceae bacterium]|nr:cyanophycin synthetase [Treponemataceae bacterium]